MRNKQPFLPLVKNFFESDPISASRILESMGEDDAAEVLKKLPYSLILKAINNLDDSFAASLLFKKNLDYSLSWSDSRHGGILSLSIP